MPKVFRPLFSDQARGGFQGVVFNTWRGINTVKKNTSPSNQQTSARILARTRLIDASKEWRNLTEAQRDGWRTFANEHTELDWTGAMLKKTGFDWFVSCYVNSIRCGGSGVTTAPSSGAPSAPSNLTLTANGGVITAAYTLTSQTNYALQIWSTDPMSKGINAVKEMAKWVQNANYATATSQAVKTVTSSGRVTVFVKATDKVTGMTSGFVKAYVDVVI